MHCLLSFLVLSDFNIANYHIQMSRLVSLCRTSKTKCLYQESNLFSFLVMSTLDLILSSSRPPVSMLLATQLYLKYRTMSYELIVQYILLLFKLG